MENLQIQVMANKSRSYLQKSLNETPAFFPDFLSLETLTDEQVLRILRHLYELRFRIEAIRMVATSNSYTVQASEDPEGYLTFAF